MFTYVHHVGLDALWLLHVLESMDVGYRQIESVLWTWYYSKYWLIDLNLNINIDCYHHVIVIHNLQRSILSVWVLSYCSISFHLAGRCLLRNCQHLSRWSRQEEDQWARQESSQLVHPVFLRIEVSRFLKMPEPNGDIWYILDFDSSTQAASSRCSSPKRGSSSIQSSGKCAGAWRNSKRVTQSW